MLNFALLAASLVACAPRHAQPQPYALHAHQIAQATLEQNHRTWPDGTEWWAPAPDYPEAYALDMWLAFDGAPEWFTADQIRAVAAAFLAQQDKEGNLPIALDAETGLAARWYGGCPRMQSRPGGDAALVVPLMLQLAWMKDGKNDAALLDDAARALDAIPRNPASGLVYVAAVDPWIPFGFQDNAIKTGDDLMGSLLYWDAAYALATLMDSEEWVMRADQITVSLATLRDPVTGMYFAASGQNRQIDILGSAYAATHGARSSKTARAISEWLVTYYGEITRHGFVRQSPQDWAVLPHPNGCPDAYDYDNGYWAVGNGWIYGALRITSPGTAAKLVRDWLDGADPTLEYIGPRNNGFTGNLVSTTWAVGAVPRPSTSRGRDPAHGP